ATKGNDTMYNCPSNETLTISPSWVSAARPGGNYALNQEITGNSHSGVEDYWNWRATSIASFSNPTNLALVSDFFGLTDSGTISGSFVFNRYNLGGGVHRGLGS